MLEHSFALDLNSMDCDRTVLRDLAEIYERATLIPTGRHLTTVNTFTDQTEPLKPSLLKHLALLISKEVCDGSGIDLIVGEEDKGAHITTAVALHLDKPFSLARWYPYHATFRHPASVVVDVESEYFSGKLLLNGVPEGARVLIVDDTLSTGGTMIALIRALLQRKACVVKAVSVVEKVNESGRDRVQRETGVEVVTLLKLDTSGGRITIVTPPERKGQCASGRR
ncbi:MAG: adenine phosphoribosyltransferase [Verrucomicrobia bacterium]|nr:adenine phosphoribosyltransferase [Verrucomicrobiota bacterium]